MKLFIPNFDFEHQLPAGANYQLSDKLKRINAELIPAFLGLMENGDAILSENLVDPSWEEQLSSQGLPVPKLVKSPEEASFEICPWGWTEQIIAKGITNTPHPPVEIVQAVNSRNFSFELETEWNVGLQGAFCFEDIESLEKHLKNQPAGEWLIKAEYSNAGRERIEGESAELSESQVNWIQKRFSAGQKLFFEPKVNAIREAGFQFTVPQSGEPVLEGIVPLVSSRAGGFQGSLFYHSNQIPADWNETVETAGKAAERIQSEGYYGPLGIDAMIYRDHQGNEAFRPIQDINARWTMGRCALELRKYLSEGKVGYFFHMARKNPDSQTFIQEVEKLSQSLNPAERILRLSPERIDQQPVRLQMFLIVTNEEKHCLALAEELIQRERSV